MLHAKNSSTTKGWHLDKRILRYLFSVRGALEEGMCNLTSWTELHLICCICSVPVHFTAPSMALHSHEFTSYNSSFLPVTCIWSMPSLHMIKMLLWNTKCLCILTSSLCHFANCLVHHLPPFFFSLPCRQLWLG